LTKDTADYVENKLPNNDYDFEIIYNAYPERVNGKIPNEVIVFVANALANKIGKKHAQFIPFYKYLWEKKGENGKLAFCIILSKLVAKNPDLYLPILDNAINTASENDLVTLLEKVMLPQLRKNPNRFLPQVYKWTASHKEKIRKRAIDLLIKLMKKDPHLIDDIVQHFLNQWYHPLGDLAKNHITLLKAVAKLNPDTYLNIWRQFDMSRDPQIAELLCNSITFYHPEIDQTVERWTKSGNARLKKTALAAQKLLQKKKSQK
jgi:hypothetical protein